MDSDLVKLIPLLAGSLALLGSILTFINGRLNDAKTEAAKRSVHENSLISGSTGLFILGLLISSFAQQYAVACILFSVSFLIQTYLFLARPGTATRGEVVIYSLQTSLFLSLLIASFVFSMFSQIISLQHDMLITESKLIGVSSGAGSRQPSANSAESADGVHATK